MARISVITMATVAIISTVAVATIYSLMIATSTIAVVTVILSKAVLRKQSSDAENLRKKRSVHHLGSAETSVSESKGKTLGRIEA